MIPNQRLCSVLKTPGGTTSYSWSIDESIGLSPTSGTGNIPSFTALNEGPPYEPLIATITVTPTFTNAGVTCAGATETFTITVNPSAQVDDPTDLVLCHNDTQSEIVFSTQNTGGTTSYSWSIDESIGLSPTSGTGNIPSFTALNEGPPYEPLIANDYGNTDLYQCWCDLRRRYRDLHDNGKSIGLRLMILLIWYCVIMIPNQRLCSVLKTQEVQRLTRGVLMNQLV